MILKELDKIIIKDEFFDPKEICTCGQVFRYRKENGVWYINSRDKQAKISLENDTYVIYGNSDYFYNYFDLNNDYSSINESLNNKPLINNALSSLKGIRILKQDPLETIISFIISANNHIPRIKGIIERICASLGENIDGYYTFPTIDKLKSADKSFFRAIGCGYRDEYLYNTISLITNSEFDINKPYSMDTESAKSYLMRLNGVGPKVADCILLFAYQKYDVFPVDTWIKKLYFRLFPQSPLNTDPKIMRTELVNTYGEYAGIAQQYLFYSIREE